MSDTPYTDLHETHWEDFAGSNIMVVEADRCRKLELDRAILLEALKDAADALDKLTLSWFEELKKNYE